MRCEVRVINLNRIPHRERQCSRIAVKGNLCLQHFNISIKPTKPTYAELEAIQCHIYNSGYHAGHEDTVESCYTDIFTCDMDTYHQEVVSELVADLMKALGDKV